VPIDFECECAQPLSAPDAHAGRKATCPACGREVEIPKPQPPLSQQAWEFLADHGVHTRKFWAIAAIPLAVACLWWPIRGLFAPDAGGLLVGSCYADAIIGCNDGQLGVRNPEKVFLWTTVAVARRRLMAPETEYQEIVAQVRQESPSRAIYPREQTLAYDPRRFRLIWPDGATVAAELLCVSMESRIAPDKVASGESYEAKRYDTSGDFHRGAMALSNGACLLADYVSHRWCMHCAPFDLDASQSLVVVWVVDRQRCKPRERRGDEILVPFHVQLDDGTPAPVVKFFPMP